MDNNILASNLKTVRTVMGLTQAEFAALPQRPTKTYAHHEQGNSEPSITTMQRIIEMTGKPLKAFTDGLLSEMPSCDLSETILTTMAKLAAKNNAV